MRTEIIAARDASALRKIIRDHECAGRSVVEIAMSDSDWLRLTGQPVVAISRVVRRFNGINVVTSDGAMALTVQLDANA